MIEKTYVGNSVFFQTSLFFPRLKKQNFTFFYRNAKGKTRRLKDELTEVKAELERTRMEKEELSRSLTARNNNSDFGEILSSTIRDEQISGNETLPKVNSMSLNCINIGECVPAAEDTELNKRVYDHWKSVLTASMNLIQLTDESIRMDVFRIKA